MVILTDLSEVLIKGVFGAEKYVKEYYGAKVAKRYLNRRREINTIFCELLRGHISENIYWEVFLQQGKWPFGVEELKRFISLNIAEDIPGTLDVYQRIISYPDTLTLTKKINEISGRPEIWLVSDHISEREEELEYLHPEIFTLTSRQIWSFDYSTLKGDPGFFEYLLSCYRLSPEEVLLVDDLEINTEAAHRAGIKSILFKNAEQLESRLRRLGFDFADTVQEANKLNAY